jgi:hypothetical protein
MRVACANILRQFKVTTKNKQENVKTQYGVSLGLEGVEISFVPRS